MSTYRARALCWAMACLFASTAGAQKPALPQAPAVRDAPGSALPDRYIVVLASTVPDVPAQAEAVMRGRGGHIHQHFDGQFKGFAATIPAMALDAVRKHAMVVAVEPDPILRLGAGRGSAPEGAWAMDLKAPPGSQAFAPAATAATLPWAAFPNRLPHSSATAAALQARNGPAELASFRSVPPQAIADRYIVTLAGEVADAQAASKAVMRGRGGRVHQHFKAALRGFSATIPAHELERVRRLPQVVALEQDQQLHINQAVMVERQATWGLDRIDQVDRPLDSQYTYQRTGAGVTAFVLDTGIRADHGEFAGRVLPGYSVVADGEGSNDCNGHGTHVAGIVGGSTWGVAKAVTLVPVRVMDCSGSGSVSGVIAGLDWAASSPLRPAVANLSLGGSPSVALNVAVAAAVAKGLVVVVAAGNSATDACTTSPANAPSAITVGATNSGDTKASFSNEGACVDIFAPGSAITSAWHTSNSASATLSGTSMASPAVAGVAALALQANPAAAPAAVAKYLVDSASGNKLAGLGTTSPNRLLYSMAAGVPGVVPTKTVAVASLWYGTQAPARPMGLWYAKISVAVRDIHSGAPVALARVAFAQSPGGSASCTTDASGRCAIAHFFDTAATISVTGISGSALAYEATQNLATELRLPAPPYGAFALPDAR